jgi:hypothetical protein
MTDAIGEARRADEQLQVESFVEQIEAHSIPATFLRVTVVR